MDAGPDHGLAWIARSASDHAEGDRPPPVLRAPGEGDVLGVVQIASQSRGDGSSAHQPIDRRDPATLRSLSAMKVPVRGRQLVRLQRQHGERKAYGRQGDGAGRTPIEDEPSQRCPPQPATLPSCISRWNGSLMLLAPATPSMSPTSLSHLLRRLAHSTRFERVTFVFGGQR